MALQIDALFPLHGSTLRSPSDILKLLENPPKDLAEAFNQALHRISDTRYGKTIFQLIATAKRPLTISELKIALHVKPGDTDWTSITLSLPQDETAIVGLCGGDLLEIDEEDMTVRFIHHSVVQHLQQPMLSEHQSTPCHFREYEADIHMGLICTTYLNYSIFNTALYTVNTAVIVTPDQFTHKITGSCRHREREHNSPGGIKSHRRDNKEARPQSARQFSTREYQDRPAPAAINAAKGGEL